MDILTFKGRDDVQNTKICLKGITGSQLRTS
jgi:hypothetical protein